MKTLPKITVLMPVYNCETYLQTAIDSILNQSYTDFEFLIIDDASTDSTVSIIQSYKDSRIHLIEKSINSGYTNSLNYGFTIANGKYIARMDGDDISFPQRFAKQIAYLEANPEVVVCGTTYKLVGNEKQIIIPEKHDAIKIGLLAGNCIMHPSVMIRKKILDEFSIYYDSFKEPAEDYEMWVRLLQFGKFHNLQEVLFEYRLHSSQVSRKRAAEQKKNDVKVKFQLLNYLNIKWDTNEYEFLERNFRKTDSIDFNDVKIFKQIQKKLACANSSGFFESKGFSEYLLYLESDVLRKCFLKQERYSPRMYFDYLSIKYLWKARLKTEQEIKLVVKSLIFWKTYRVKSKKR